MLHVTILLILLGARPATATVLVPMSDGNLVRSSAVVAVGEVRRIETVRLRRGRIFTEVTLAVEELLKGGRRRGKVVITTAGGRVGDTMAWTYGSPEFTVGERVLVFLRRAGGRRLRVNALALGKYRLVGGMAVRGEPVPETRDAASFLAALRTLGTGAVAEPTPSGRAATPPGDVAGRVVTGRFTLLSSPPFRWFETTVLLPVANADPALGATASDGLVDDAMAVWSNVGTASLVLAHGGSTSVAPSIADGVCDGANTIQFDDPFDELDDLVECTGLLAIGGFCTTSGSIDVNGTTFGRISEGDVTANDGLGACAGSINTAEVMTHEIGHVIGLGHSSEKLNEGDPDLSDATMYFLAHFDGRGAGLRADDRAGIGFIYPASSPAPDADEDGVPDAVDQCPGTPAGLGVDPSGCACSDPGHESCDDLSVCTDDSCDVGSGHCVNAPIDCSDADPCTIDACEAVEGCMNPPAPDTDADGVCDPIDNCPRLAFADPTDADGNGVGDACECTAARPGDCVPGRGKASRRCLVEWRPLSPITLRRGLPAPVLRCTDGDPGCDTDATPRGSARSTSCCA